MAIKGDRDRGPRGSLMGGLEGARRILKTQGSDGVVSAVRAEVVGTGDVTTSPRLMGWDQGVRRSILNQSQPTETFGNIVVSPELEAHCRSGNGPQGMEKSYVVGSRESIHD